MINRFILKIIFLSFLKAQIALPTFQGTHVPQSPSSSSGPYTFTNCGATGKNGPSQSNCNSEYSGSSLDGVVTVSSGIQTWTVPSSGTYTIEVWGADGGNGDDNYSYESLGGNGKKLKANFSLAQDAVLKILVGQSGGIASVSSNSTNAGGGGGGTFVTYSNNTPIIVASGGNGGSWGYWNVDGPDGLLSNLGNTNGGSKYGRGGSGAGLTGNGTTYRSSDHGISFINGGTGGTKSRSTSGDGGFGGGGGAYYEGGGGGGYNGGTVVNTNQYNTDYPSYGAGSFTADNASSIVDIGTNDGVGKVIITKN
tara:strand:+ start:249 stop:1175 length:927 start_codon:yes stop_codon:yes gene_type:complete